VGKLGFMVFSTVMNLSKTLNHFFKNQKRNYDLEEVEMFSLNKGLKKVEFFESGRIDYERFISPYVKILPNYKILDFGCGNGRLARNFLPENYLGVDLNQKLLSQAMEKNPGYRFEVIKLLQEDQKREFDLIFALASLIHLERFSQLDQTLEIMSDLMTAHGTLLLSFRTKPEAVRGRVLYWVTLFDGYYFSIVRRKFVIFPFLGKFDSFFGICVSPKKLSKFALKNGLKIIKYYYLDKYLWFILKKE
jgi:SAM-dependent methyltransferase